MVLKSPHCNSPFHEFEHDLFFEMPTAAFSVDELAGVPVLTQIICEEDKEDTNNMHHRIDIVMTVPLNESDFDKVHRKMFTAWETEKKEIVETLRQHVARVRAHVSSRCSETGVTKRMIEDKIDELFAPRINDDGIIREPKRMRDE
jgi:hypothetical protein